MNHWAFVTAAYAVTVLGVGGLVAWAYAAMRRAEAAAEALRQPHPNPSPEGEER